MEMRYQAINTVSFSLFPLNFADDRKTYKTLVPEAIYLRDGPPILLSPKQKLTILQMIN